MKLLRTGMMLYSTDLLKDTFFEKSIIFISEIKPDGPVGFILNKPFERKFNELVEFQHHKALDLFVGGPMEPEKLFFLHHCHDLIPDGQLIASNIYLGGDFAKMLNLLGENKIKESEIKILLGYCGWDNGQLEAEIEEGSWVLDNFDPSLIFQH